MPGDDGLRLDEHEALAPLRPEAGERSTRSDLMSEAGAVSYWFVAGQRAGGGEPGFPFAGRLAFAPWMQARRILISTHCT